MKKLLLVLACFLPLAVMACPGCNDDFNTKTGAKMPPYTFIILGIFILSTYIPFYILFRAAKKYEPQKFDGNE